MEGTENQVDNGGQRVHTPGSANRQSDRLEEEYHFDPESTVLRRADPDDCDAIINLVEIGEDDIYNRVYSYPKILKLIETAFLAITVIDKTTGSVVGFAAFEDFPQGQRGMTDDKHFNLWEDWMKNAFRVQEFSAFNSLWLAYFIAGGVVGVQNQQHIFKQVLKTVYTSLPDLIGVLFLVRGDADEDDIKHCFDPLAMFFEQLAMKDREHMAAIRGIHKDSEVHFSSRVNVIPYIEVRPAKQEDHDDLADVFNSQSETVTEAYGEYFIAELIASQDVNNKALVAQVKDKAVGLMGLTREVDLKLLNKCFEIETYDCLLKPEYIDAIRARRQHLKAQETRAKENEEIAAQRRLKETTMQCNVIAQRIMLQEHLLVQADDLYKFLDEAIMNEETYNKLTCENIGERVFNQWLEGFNIQNPDDYFKDQSDNVDLVCNTQDELNFMMTTLEIFGLEKGYLEGRGHHNDWTKDAGNKNDKKKGKGKKDTKKRSFNSIAKKLGKEVAEDTRPVYFDLKPFRETVKKFLNCQSEERSKLRTLFLEKQTQVRNVFKDSHGEISFKKVMDVGELAQYLAEGGVSLDQNLSESLGSLLLCFGDIEIDAGWADRIPADNEEQRKNKIFLQMEESAKQKDIDERTKKAATGLYKPPTEEEEIALKAENAAREEKIAEYKLKSKPKPPVKQWIRETSIHDLLISLDRMAEYDRMLSDLGKIPFDGWSNEDRVLKKLNRPYIKEFVELPEIHGEQTYSSDKDIQKIVEGINDCVTIPDPNESAKNAFAVTLFCMESMFDNRSKDFLKYAFDMFPDRDYLIVTQPHTIAETALLNKFSIVPKKPENTFSHVLYVLHRDQLYEQDMHVSRTTKADLDQIQALIESSGASTQKTEDYMKQITNATTSFASPNLSFCARIENQVIATFMISKDVNLDYYISHFHIQDQILLTEHERKGHSRMVYSVINPIFEKSCRFFLKEVLRLSGKTCLYFEVQKSTVIPTTFHELIHVRSRRFPHFLDRKWDHERWENKSQSTAADEEVDKDFKVPVDGADRKADDETESPFALCFTSKKLLSEAKIVKNARIVVIGASDTGISFVEALLSITYLHFTNITLIAPGGLPHHHLPSKKTNLKCQSTSYTNEELQKLMLESRITVLDARMTDIDRNDKNVILDDGKVVPYDTLILTMGIQEKTLDSLKFASWGISPVPSDIRRCRGVLSIDDPHLYKTLMPENPLMQKLTDRRRGTKCVVYGRTLNVFALIQGLIDRGVQPKNIIIAIPRRDCHVNEDTTLTAELDYIYPNAFEDESLEQCIENMLVGMGATIITECKLIEIISDKDKNVDPQGTKNSSPSLQPEQQAIVWDHDCNLDRIVLKRLDIPDEEEEEEEMDIDEKSQSEHQNEDGHGMNDESNVVEEERSQMDGDGSGNQEKKKKRKKNELELECGVLITCGHRDVDTDVFQSIHNNGLVYNGRLIVDKNFRTTDQSIFAAGSLCEFSGRYASLSQGRSLRMDRYNGREMGSRLARSVFDLYDPQTQNDMAHRTEELPLFYIPSGLGAVLPNNLIYYHIKTTNPISNVPEKFNRDPLICDNLLGSLEKGQAKGHWIKFAFNSIGLIDSVTYMGSDEVVLQSLWSFVGLHENYLNLLTERHEKGIIPNVVEFLSENWAIALYHEWFGDFCLRMRTAVRGLSDVQQILHEAFDKSKTGQGLERSYLKDIRTKLDDKTVRMIEDETLEFIKTNMNHLPMYYIPGQEFA